MTAVTASDGSKKCWCHPLSAIRSRGYSDSDGVTANLTPLIRVCAYASV